MITAFRLVPSWCYWLLALVALCLGCEIHGRHAVQAKWNKAEIIRSANEKAQIDIRIESNRMLAQAQAATTTRISDANHKAIASVNSSLDAARHAVAVTAGLRVAVACNQIAGSTSASGAGGSNGTDTRTVALPDQVTSDLLDLAAEADKVVEQLRSAQDFIRSNGFAP